MLTDDEYRLMDLPDYFLIDTPDRAELRPEMLRNACQAIRENRERYLLERSAVSIVKTLCRLGESWLDEAYPFRQLALEEGPERTGFSSETLRRGLDEFFRQFTPENFEHWLIQEFGHVERLDGFPSTREESRMQRAGRVEGVPLITHVTAGNIPVSAMMSMVTGLLVKSAQFVKCSSRNSFLPRLFAHSIYEREHKLGACLELVAWEGGNEELESVVFGESDCVTASGSDETLDGIRRRMPGSTRFIGYGHKVSFSYVSRKALGGLNPARIVEDVASDVAAWDQQGCLSPHVVYVQLRGEVSTDAFADQLASRLAELEVSEPRGTLTTAEAAAIATRRGFYEIRSAHLTDTVHWFSEESTAWSVIHEADIRFQPSCLNRFVYVKPVEDLAEALHGAAEYQGRVSTVGIAASGEEMDSLAMELSRWGVSRICPVGRMQNPPLCWRHDGRPALADLVRWTDLEL